MDEKRKKGLSARRSVIVRARQAADRVDAKLPARWHALLIGGYVIGHFRGNGLPCSLIPMNDWNVWFPLWTSDSNVTAFEVLFGGESSRSDYNVRCLAETRRTRRPLVAEFHGFSDMFVPIITRKSVLGFLAAGPFSREPLAAHDILDRFRQVAGRTPRADDPDLLRYAASVLAVPVLDRALLRASIAYLQQVAKALAGEIAFRELRRRAVQLERRSFARDVATSVSRVARGLVDPVTQGFWSAGFRQWDRESIGIDRLPTVVIAVAPAAPTAGDALEALVSSDRFARSCTEVALDVDATIAGSTEGGLAYFLTYCDPALPERRARSAVLARIAALARALGMRLHVGVSPLSPDPRDLPRNLERAARALEWAVHKQRPIVFHDDEQAGRGPSEVAFRSLPTLLRAVSSGDRTQRERALEQLVSEVVWRSGSLLLAAKSYAEAIHSQVVVTVQGQWLLEPRALSEQTADFENSLDRARSVSDVADALRRHVTALGDQPPGGTARHALGLKRALAYIDEHIAEPLTPKEVARIAGYAPDYFTRVLRAREGRTFEQHLLARRIARAKELLRTSDLGVARVAAVSGFRTESYFYRVFRAAAGKTPDAFRRAARRRDTPSRRGRIRKASS